MTQAQQFFGYEIGGASLSSILKFYEKNFNSFTKINMKLENTFKKFNFKILGKKRHNSYYEKEQPRLDLCTEHEIKENLFFPHLIKAHLQNGTVIDLTRALSYCWIVS